MGFGCTIGGAAGTRVIDNWGQRLLAIILVWSVPCAATWSVMQTLAQIFFGSGAIFVLLGILLFMFVIMAITAKIFGNKLAPKEARAGMIMELPPYHKPKWGHIFRTTLSKGVDIFLRALKVITVVSLVFWLLSYTESGNVETVLFTKSVLQLSLSQEFSVLDGRPSWHLLHLPSVKKLYLVFKVHFTPVR